jgi:hypothetical protein
VLPLVFRVRLGERFVIGRSTDDCVARLEQHYRAELPACRPAAWLAIQPAAAAAGQATGQPA